MLTSRRTTDKRQSVRYSYLVVRNQNKNMGKLQVEPSREKKVKKSKKSKTNNKIKNGQTNATEAIPNLPPEPDTVDINKIIAKQQEACSVIEQKKDILASNQLSYLEYVEMQEEIVRLKNLRDEFQAKINILRKYRKRNESGVM